LNFFSGFSVLICNLAFKLLLFYYYYYDFLFQDVRERDERRRVVMCVCIFFFFHFSFSSQGERTLLLRGLQFYDLQFFTFESLLMRGLLPFLFLKK